MIQYDIPIQNKYVKYLTMKQQNQLTKNSFYESNKKFQSLQFKKGFALLELEECKAVSHE